ncbi:helix-turn-helix protein [Melghirimyces profundicolus]|uniref:Helix-turn-helix protein n=1 Tax=Melghirimyces profundicolus TaxID=1242148 RepID=A0A2T6B148_9BACL|nr:helix-turn-helix transcriptional regulator [Melghirimyces profundicolus]PTX49806.1 helix-turn-helix protein [Melghirimyces profundicolus]
MGTVRVVLRKTLKEMGMTQKELAEKAQIHEATISLLARDTRTSINKEAVAKIMDALGIDDIRKVIDYVPDEE